MILESILDQLIRYMHEQMCFPLREKILFFLIRTKGKKLDHFHIESSIKQGVAKPAFICVTANKK